MRAFLRRCAALAAVVWTVGAPAHAAAPEAEAAVRLDAGVRQVEDGDLETAVQTLAAALPGLGADPDHVRDLIKGHLYLGMAHLGLGHDPEARTHFRHAWTLSGGERLDPKSFPPRVIAIYQESRTDGTAPPPKATPPPRPKSRPGSPIAQSALTFGLGAAAGISVASLAPSGQTSAVPPPPAAPAERTVRVFNCDDRCRVWLNGQLVAEVGLNQDSGRIDVTSRLGGAANTVVFEAVNERGGVSYGFEVRVGEAIVFQEICGIAVRLGCEDDRSFPPGVVRRYEYVLAGK